MNKIQLGIVFGGKSAEHDVSIMSTKSVLNVIHQDKYKITMYYITKSGDWHICDDVNQLDFSISDKPISSEILESLYKQEVILPVIHGPHGEDGSLQGFFESLEIPYVGSKVLGSSVCMDKIISKKIMKQAGLSAVRYFEMYESMTPEQMTRLKEFITQVGYPVFVKPSNMGSSVGISKVSCETHLEHALLEAFKYDHRLLIEEGIDAREIECAVLEHEGLLVSGVGEVLASNDFYDYEAKYTDDGQEKMMVPAENIEPEIIEQIRDIARQAFLEHGCNGLARVDFFLEKKTNRIILNEINTLPGMTAYSMYPALFKEKGIAYGDLIDLLIANALK